MIEQLNIQEELYTLPNWLPEACKETLVQAVANIEVKRWNKVKALFLDDQFKEMWQTFESCGRNREALCEYTIRLYSILGYSNTLKVKHQLEEMQQEFLQLKEQDLRFKSTFDRLIPDKNEADFEDMWEDIIGKIDDKLCTRGYDLSDYRNPDFMAVLEELSPLHAKAYFRIDYA